MYRLVAAFARLVSARSDACERTASENGAVLASNVVRCSEKVVGRPSLCEGRLCGEVAHNEHHPFLWVGQALCCAKVRPNGTEAFHRAVFDVDLVGARNPKRWEHRATPVRVDENNLVWGEVANHFRHRFFKAVLRSGISWCCWRRHQDRVVGVGVRTPVLHPGNVDVSRIVWLQDL